MQVSFLGKPYLPGSFSKYSLLRISLAETWALHAGTLAHSESMRKLVLFAFGPGKLTNLRVVQVMAAWLEYHHT